MFVKNVYFSFLSELNYNRILKKFNFKTWKRQNTLQVKDMLNNFNLLWILDRHLFTVWTLVHGVGFSTIFQ